MNRRYAALAAAILALALFNLTFRLNQEFVAEWDESLYAINAWEIVTRQSWIATTFLGEIDYYNTKPPLMAWMIALAFKAFGPGFVPLRLFSVVSAWLTVLVVMLWTRRAFGARISLASGLVLATTFGFIHVHSGRSAATDAPFTLVMTLTAVVLWMERERPSWRLWLGPLLAAAFMLRGMAVLMPLALMLVVWIIRRSERGRWRFTAGAFALCVLPIAAWAIARFRIDGWAFFHHLFMYDFVARTTSAIEEHPGGPFFYLDELQKNQFDWLLAAVAAVLLFPLRWRDVRVEPVLAAVAAVTLVIPSVMATKVPWYLNTFFPVFAILVALVVVRAFESAQSSNSSQWRLRVLVGVVAVVVVAAESRLIWYSFNYRDLSRSEQSLVLQERAALQGQRVYLVPNSNATRFVADAIVKAEPLTASDRAAFVRDSRPGDYLLTNTPCGGADTREVASTGRHFLCVRH
jgi:4-amino-4-deoxy-L-arabinose transferase-like glycosyltransferase